MTEVVQVVVSAATVGSVLGLVALGYNLVFSATRIVNFAQGTMLVVAGYTAYALTREGAPIWAAFVLTVLLSAAFGALVELVAIRPLGRFDPGRNMGWVLTTFAVTLVSIDLVRLAVDAEPHPLPDLAGSILGWRRSTVAGVPVTATDVVIVVGAVVMMVLIEALQRRTTAGRAFRAVAQDRQTAALMGINPSAVVLTTFAVAGALAGVGAVLLAPKLFVRLDNGELLGVQAFVAAVLGGLGSTRGAVVGGYLIALTSAIVRTVEVGDRTFVQWEPLVVFAVFMAVLVLRPNGIYGQADIEKA
ncbi:MAG TPA: branched-chain amino acid ABC transporter permease [Acidimicrobiales bacterium]|nr:branched-chain amino acid ABC transporter permease [Acidimicrobiales bacterium]